MARLAQRREGMKNPAGANEATLSRGDEGVPRRIAPAVTVTPRGESAWAPRISTTARAALVQEGVDLPAPELYSS